MKTLSCNSPAAGKRFLLRSMLTAFTLWACLPIFLGGNALQAASPDLQYAQPRGGQRGTEVNIKIVGSRLWDAEEIIFHEPGITWKEIKHDEKKSGRFFNVKFVVSKDAKLGENTFRVRTKSGLSYARRFWVSQFAEVKEAEPNNEFETPQEVAINSTVEGYAKPETADFYRINAKKGQRISVEVEGIRANSIRNRIGIDPYCAIMNADRFELSASDDTALLKQDCYTSLIAPEDGQYTILVRDASYKGNGFYRVHIGTFPRPKAIFPAGGEANSEVEVTLIGDEKGTYKKKVKLPASADDDYGIFADHEGQMPPSANKFRVSPYKNVLEDESANEYWKQIEKSAGSLPLAFNGILQEKPDKDGVVVFDYDYFRFTAKKGEKFRFRAHAKKINSPVDTVMHIYRVKDGKYIGGNDDADGSTDSRYDFTPPEDGDYAVRIYDMLKRGGEDFVYRIETEKTAPALVVSMPEFTRNDNQFRKSMDVPRGGRFATVVNVTRQNVRCATKFEIKGLPAGIEAHYDDLPANVTQFPIVFTAKKDAPLGTALTELFAHSTEKDQKLSGKYTQTMDYVRGNPNGTLYYSKTENVLPVTVAEEAPFTLDLIKTDNPIVRDGTAKMKVVAKRKEGFTKPITVRWMWRPPGISCNTTATIPEGKNETVFSLNCNATAEIRTWKVCVMGESDAGKGKFYTSSDLIDLPVADHFVKMKINLATTKQGQPGEVLVDVEGIRDFSGEATVSLIGLPTKTKSEAIKLKKGQEQIKFVVPTEIAAPVGQHKNVFCQLVFTENGKEVRQRAGFGGIYRIDPKPKAPAKPKPVAVVAKNAAPKKVAAPAPPKPAKPLSRLEQLRLDAKRAAEAKK